MTEENKIIWTPRTVSVDKLRPYERNPRIITKDAYDRLKAAISELGYHQRIVAQPDLSVIGGHQRIRALKELGFKEIEVLIPSRPLTTDEFRRLLIQDNLPFGSHDFDILAADFEMEELKDWGMPEKWFEGKVEGEKVEETDGDDDVPETPKVAASKTGDVWVLGNHRVMCGDSRSEADVKILMDGAPADMIFTDPPYGVDYEGIKNDSRKGLKELLHGAFVNFKAHTRNGAPIYVFHSDRCADIFHEVFREFCHFSSMVIWVKPALVLSQTDYQSQHEPCMYGWILGASHPWHSDRKQTSLWAFGKEKVEEHTTPKPVGFCAQAMVNSSKEGEIILDLFGGSGSTLMAADKVHRKARIMELDPRYVDVIVTRWQAKTGHEAHHAATGQTFDSVKLSKPA